MFYRVCVQQASDPELDGDEERWEDWEGKERLLREWQGPRSASYSSYRSRHSQSLTLAAWEQCVLVSVCTFLTAAFHSLKFSLCFLLPLNPLWFLWAFLRVKKKKKLCFQNTVVRVVQFVICCEYAMYVVALSILFGGLFIFWFWRQCHMYFYKLWVYSTCVVW